MLEIGEEWILHTGVMRFKETDAPPAIEVSPNTLSIYAKDKAGVSALYYKDDAGVEKDLSGGLTGTGTSGYVTFWTGSTTLSGESNLFWDATNNWLGIGSATPTGALDIYGTSAPTTTIAIERTTGQGSFWGYRVTGSANTVDQALAMFGGGGSHTGATANRAVQALLAFYAAETWSASAKGEYITLETTPIGSTAMAIHARLDPNSVAGAILTVGGGSGGLSAINAIDLIGRTGSASNSLIRQTANGTGAFGNFQGRMSRGTASSPTATQANETIARFSAIQYGATGYASGARATVDLVAGENATDSAQGTYIKFQTTALLGTTLTERLRIGPAGQVGIGGATYGSSGDIFSSAGSAAPPTWVTRATLNAALDHGTLAGLTDDDHTGYALLAGRNGGQTLIGGTASADTLTIKSTSHGDGSKLVVNSITIASGSDIGAAVEVAPTFTGAATAMRGFRALTTFQPTAATLSAGISFIGFAIGDPAAGKTIGLLAGLAPVFETGSNGGAVTSAYSIYIPSPTIGSVKPTLSVGVEIENHGAVSITNAIGLRIQAQTGATNNYDMAFGTVDTTAAGAYYGRVPVLYNGLLKYLHLFSA